MCRYDYECAVGGSFQLLAVGGVAGESIKIREKSVDYTTGVLRKTLSITLHVPGYDYLSRLACLCWVSLKKGRNGIYFQLLPIFVRNVTYKSDKFKTP